MRLTVIIPSRGRAFQLLASIRTAQQAESGNHEVTYIVGCDADDPQTIGMCQMLRLPTDKGGPVTAHCFDRTGSLGEMVNQMALDVPGDVYVGLCDDVLIRTEGWDQKIAEAVEARPDGVFFWKTDPSRPAAYAIITEKWRAAAGYLYTSHFPFWWDDLWLIEVWVLASEGPWLYIDAELEDRPNRTQRMRDLLFWHDFFHRMKPKRIEEAKRIAAALGWKLTGITEALAEEILKPSPAFYAEAGNIERGQGDVAVPPTPEYVAAKERAERLLEAA